MIAGCVPSAVISPQAPPANAETIPELEELWQATAKPYLQDDLWQDRDIYDAGHVLLPPLEAAFRGGITSWQEDFADHFERLVVAEDLGAVSEARLARLQYFYVAAHFMNLASTYGHAEIIPEGLKELLFSEVDSVWNDQEAWQWGTSPFPNMKARLQWKIENLEVEPSYLRAVIDEELFTFALAADLRVFERATVAEPMWSPVVSDVLALAEIVVSQESTYPDNGWLFQVGAWTDHPDYAYAGRTTISDEMSPAPRTDVATDSSHSARWPVWIASLRDSSAPGSDEALMYSEILDRMGNQFADRVLVLPSESFPYLRMNNYMDGWNGLYRWGYETVRTGEGTEGYGLSGSLFVLWWGLIPDMRVNAAFCDLGESFPLSDKALELYVGPNTSRERHPLVEWPDYFENGFAELNVRLMCAVGRVA